MSDDEADPERARKEGLQIERSVPGSVDNTMQASIGVSTLTKNDQRSKTWIHQICFWEWRWTSSTYSSVDGVNLNFI